jgi:hypothetical protein
MSPPPDPVDELTFVWRCVLAHYPLKWPALTAQDEASALVSLLLNLSVRELQRTDAPEIRARLRRLAGTLTTLADTPAAQLEAVAQFLADVPRAGLTRQ